MNDEEKTKCHGIIHTAAVAAGAIGVGLAQIPGSDTVPITTIQVGMIVSLGAVFGKTITKTAGASILSGAVASIGGRAVSQFLLGWIPGLGNAINAGTAFAITESIGWYVANNFANEVEIDSKISDNTNNAQSEEKASVIDDVKKEEISDNTNTVQTREEAAVIAVEKEESRKLSSFMMVLMLLFGVISVTACYFIDSYINKISIHPKLWSIVSGFAVVVIIDIVIFLFCRNSKAKTIMSYSNYLAAILNIAVSWIFSPEFNTQGWDESVMTFFNMPLLNFGLMLTVLFWWFKVDERILREFN